MPKAKLIFEFDSEEDRDEFLTQLADEGGEQSFSGFTFDYKKAFPAWGYDPEKDGDPTVQMLYDEDEDEYA